MSQIRVIRNEQGNCVQFEGTTLPVYWNSCLSGEVNAENPNNINVKNDIESDQLGETKYEMFNVEYTKFCDQDGNSFNDAQSCADYITAKANVLGLSGGGLDMIGVDICFELDPTNTSILMSTGHHFGVNSIKAIPEESDTISIISVDGDESIVHFYNIEVGRVCDANGIIAGGVNDVVNELNELFTVGAFEAVVISDPFSTLIADVGGVDADYTEEGVNFINPVGDDLATNTTSNNNQAGIKSVATISHAGEYFTFDIRGKSTYGFGLVHTQDSYDSDYYSGNATYADPATFCVTNNQHSGFQFSHWFHIGNAHASWTNYGANTSYVMGPAWHNHNSEFDEKEDWNNNDPVTMKVGLGANGFIEISTKKDDGTFVLHARSNYPVPQGSEFHLGVKFYYNTARLLSAPKVHLLEIDDTPDVIGDTNIDVFGTATGTLAGGVTVSDSSGNNDGFVTVETISESGEYFEVEVNENEDHLIGLFSENDYDVATIQGDTADWSKGKYMFFGSGINTSEQMSSTVYKNATGASIGSTILQRPTGCTHFRIGFDNDGRATIWSSTDGINFVASMHHSSAAPTGDYKFMWVADTNGSTFESITKGQLSAVPTMQFRYIESPDGVFHYPLFSTEEEANWYDLHHNGTVGTGTSETISFVDDPTFTNWYRPTTGYTNDATTAPSGDTFQGSNIVWTEVTSLTNADLAPPQFTAATLTVNEFASVNYQTQPQDTGYVTTITNLPPFLMDFGGGIIAGSAPEVTGDYIANPSDTYSITVTRTNSYGSSAGTLTLIVNNLTAPVIQAISGFTHNGSSTPLIDDDVMDDGSLVDVDETLDEAQRFIINKNYVETNILPSILNTGGKYYIGVLNSGADVSSIEDSDWDFALVWEYQSSTTHKYRVIKDGVQQHSVGIGSNTNALYDYAIELYDGYAWLIGCNVNAINTEPSPALGGSFTNATQVALGESKPVTISFAYVGSASASFSETDLSEIVIPAPNDWVQVTANPSHTLNFDGSTTMPTLQAGYTYRFLMGDTQYADLSSPTGLHADDDLRFTADGSTEYTTGITRVGNPNDLNTFGAHTAYVEFVVPTDVPPLQWYTDHNTISSLNPINISGSTYVETVTGVTQEGPAANQTGTNLFDSLDHGWLSIDEQLSAGQRLVMDGAFLYDLVDAMPDNSDMYIGLKDASWTDAYSTAGFEGNAYLYIARYSTSYVRVQASASASTNAITTTVANMAQFGAFIDLTNSGNNIRLGFTYNGDGSSDDESSTAYADWGTARKVQTGDQGYGLTSVDVMFMGSGNLAGNAAGMDSTDVDWTGLSEINVPTPPVTNLTSWNKALDFSGSAERAEMVSSSSAVNPIMMAGTNNQVSTPTTSGNTVASGHPWATAIVFKTDGNASNQHMWNLGEGSGSTDDNIYVRQDANGVMYFGWGRSGDLNEVVIGNGFNSTSAINKWWGIYIAHNGTRYGSGSTAAQLADAFDIRVMHYSGGSWVFAGIGGGFADANGNRSTTTNWSRSGSSVGGRMNRQYQGDLTIGGRGSNRNWHGKVASMVVTTLKCDVAMPDDTEIQMMITDPIKWIQNYKEGNTFRQPLHTTTNTSWDSSVGTTKSFATQVWLMGDGTSDSYSNMIRNQVFPSDQNYTKLNLISMVSNDIEDVNIDGLSFG